MTPTPYSLPSSSSSSFLEGGLQSRLIKSAMSLSRFSLPEVASFSYTSLPFATLLWSSCRNSLAVAANAAAPFHFCASVIIKI